MNKTLDYIRAELLQQGMVHVHDKRKFTITNASISRNGQFVRIEATNEAGDTCYYSHYWADEVAIVDTCINLPLA